MSSALYGDDLALIHHLGYSAYAEAAAPFVLSVLPAGSTVLELGAGSGALTRRLVEAGREVVATDASTALLDLLATELPDLRSGRLVLGDDAIPPAQAIASSGHVLSYLADEAQVLAVLAEAADALEPDGVVVLDLLTRAHGELPHGVFHRSEGEGWACESITTVLSPELIERSISTRVRQADGSWREGEERHRNALVDEAAVVEVLGGAGLEVELHESPPGAIAVPGLVWVVGRRPA